MNYVRQISSLIYLSALSEAVLKSVEVSGSVEGMQILHIIGNLDAESVR